MCVCVCLGVCVCVCVCVWVCACVFWMTQIAEGMSVAIPLFIILISMIVLAILNSDH